MNVVTNVYEVPPFSCANQMRKPRNRLPRAHGPFRDVCGNRIDLTQNTHHPTNTLPPARNRAVCGTLGNSRIAPVHLNW